MKAKLFATEADLCAAFIAWAENLGARCFAEWGGWDILVMLSSGQQIGIQAKLTLNDHVILQALPSQFHSQEWPAPDFRAVLVPEDKSRRGQIAQMLGLVVFDAMPSHRTEGKHGFTPRLEDWRNWTDWNPERRHEIPETSTDSVAGSPSPITLTPWKLSALAVLAEIQVKGRIHSRRVRELGCNPSRWTQCRWITPDGERGFWIRGEKCPPFDSQHPSAFALALQNASKAA